MRENIFTENELGCIRQKALELGFMDVKFQAAVNPDIIWQKKYREYIKKGGHASMKYLENIAPKFSLKKIYKPAQTLTVFSLPYIFDAAKENQEIHSEFQGAWGKKYTAAKYCAGRDYHLVAKEKLEKIVSLPGIGAGRIVCDTTPLPERYYAALAGMGFIGKNAMLIHPENGSYFFLAFILFERSLPDEERNKGAYNFEKQMSLFCGACDKCVKACPGGALDGQGGLNAQRCYSFWSIENKLDIIQAKFKKLNSIFGCDICQDVCPYNAKPVTTSLPDFKVSDLTKNILDGNIENQSLKGSCYERTGLKGLKRNLKYLQGYTDA
ncbi:MAG: hypothetical protein OEV66_04805 [Spirochaetia bacterium]|nr:hypothetical protein [Spirochaetia bacterium]